MKGMKINQSKKKKSMNHDALCLLNLYII